MQDFFEKKTMTRIPTKKPLGDEGLFLNILLMSFFLKVSDCHLFSLMLEFSILQLLPISPSTPSIGGSSTSRELHAEHLEPLLFSVNPADPANAQQSAPFSNSLVPSGSLGLDCSVSHGPKVPRGV